MYTYTHMYSRNVTESNSISVWSVMVHCFRETLLLKRKKSPGLWLHSPTVPQLMVLLVLLSCACLEVLLILEYHVRKEILNFLNALE